MRLTVYFLRLVYKHVVHGKEYFINFIR